MKLNNWMSLGLVKVGFCLFRDLIGRELLLTQNLISDEAHRNKMLTLANRDSQPIFCLKIT